MFLSFKEPASYEAGSLFLISFGYKYLNNELLYKFSFTPNEYR